MSTFPIHRLSAQEVSHAVITAAMKVHSELGAGLLESAFNVVHLKDGIKRFVNGTGWKETQTINH